MEPLLLHPFTTSIEGVLARELGDADNFASSPYDYQRRLLTAALGDASDENLITEIVDSVQKVSILLVQKTVLS